MPINENIVFSESTSCCFMRNAVIQNGYVKLPTLKEQLKVNLRFRPKELARIEAAYGNDNAFIDTGTHHSVIVKTDGTVHVIGENNHGQCGMGDVPKVETLTQLNGLGTDNKYVACGALTTFILKQDGTVYACGFNEDGHFGLGHNKPVKYPVKIDALGNDNATIVAGYAFLLVLKTDGRIFFIGDGAHGQSGLGSLDDVTVPTQITSLGTDNKTIAAGYYHCMVMKNSGAVWVFGDNRHGQLGVGDLATRTTPVRLISLGTDNRCISCGFNVSAIIKNNRLLVAMGYNVFSHLQKGDSLLLKPTSITGLNMNNDKVICGTHHTVIVKYGGETRSFGYNAYSKLYPLYPDVNEVPFINTKTYMLKYHNIQITDMAQLDMTIKLEDVKYPELHIIYDFKSFSSLLKEVGLTYTPAEDEISLYFRGRKYCTTFEEVPPQKPFVSKRAIREADFVLNSEDGKYYTTISKEQDYLYDAVFTDTGDFLPITLRVDLEDLENEVKICAVAPFNGYVYGICVDTVEKQSFLSTDWVLNETTGQYEIELVKESGKVYGNVFKSDGVKNSTVEIDFQEMFSLVKLRSVNPFDGYIYKAGEIYAELVPINMDSWVASDGKYAYTIDKMDNYYISDVYQNGNGENISSQVDIKDLDTSVLLYSVEKLGGYLLKISRK